MAIQTPREKAIEACRQGLIDFKKEHEAVPTEYRKDFERFCKYRLNFKTGDVLTAEAWNRYVHYLKKFI